MQVSVENTGTLGRVMKVAVPGDDIDQRVASRLQNLRRTAKLNGFRPGKTPMRVIRQRFGPQVEQEVLGEVLQTTFYQAAQQEALRPAGPPQIDPGQRATGEDLVYTAAFEVYPEIELQDLGGAQAERIEAEVSDEDVERMLLSLREQRAQWNPVERGAREGDRVTIDFNGLLDGEPFPGGSAEDAQIVLGKGTLLPDFEKMLMEAKAGAALKFPLTFPDDYGQPDLAGKTVHFSVTIKQVEEPDLPPVDEEFVKGFGIESGDVAALRKMIRDNMGRELENVLTQKFKTTLFDLLLERHQIEVPKALVDEEIERIIHRNDPQQQASGGHHHHDEAELAAARPEALRRVQLGLLLAEIVQQQQLQADPDKVRAEVERLAEPFEDKQAVIDWYYADPTRLRDLEGGLLEQAVLDWVAGQVTVKPVKSSFQEVMGR